MFTGIIETLGTIIDIKKEDENLHITVNSSLTNELKIDQSVAHNGICLTVVEIENNNYTVTAIKETIEKTTIGNWNVNERINLERAMKLGDRLDGHIVQGHVDQIGVCKFIEENGGSWKFAFEYDPYSNNLTIEKGSITINGVSLTVVDSKMHEFCVAIIPYTYDHTNFKNIKTGSKVNLEFDVIGKYVAKLQNFNKQWKTSNYIEVFFNEYTLYNPKTRVNTKKGNNQLSIGNSPGPIGVGGGGAGFANIKLQLNRAAKAKNILFKIGFILLLFLFLKCKYKK